MKRRSEMHVIGMAGLLAALGGFADDVQAHSRGRYELYTPVDLDLMRRYYRRHRAACGRLERGKCAELASVLGRTPAGLRASMNRLRARGALPPLSRAAA